MVDYDKELINSRIIEVCDYYVPGEGRAEGYKRRKWDCPECGGDNFTANTEQEIAGCFSPSCDVPQTTKAIGIIAYFEGYEMKGRDFVECLKRGYDILGIPEPEDEGKHKAGSGVGSVKSRKQNTDPESAESKASSAATAPTNGKGSKHSISPVTLPAALQLWGGLTMPSANGAGGQDEGEPSKEFIHRVYEAWMEMCPLVDSHREFWHGRGVNYETIRQGGFGSLSPDRCRYVLSSLRERFGMNALLAVPGFKEGPNGELHTNLFGEYTLIPYYDREGYITTIEGRVPGQPQGKAPKYMAPVGAGSHLYVFPTFKPEHVMAFCEGLMGAVIAAQNGIAVASIKGCRCYRRSPVGKGTPYRVLAELLGVDFGGRPVYYIPDLDVKEKTRAEVEKAAPQAAKWLIEKQNGAAYIARLPEDGEDLDTWLLSMDENERMMEFVKLTQAAVTPKQWKAEVSGEEQSGQTDDLQTESIKETAASNGATDSGGALHYSSQTDSGSGQYSEQHSGDDTQDATQTGEEQENRAVTNHRKEYEEEQRRLEEMEQQNSSKTEEASQQPRQQERLYRPIPKTNFGEFMVGLIYGAVAGIAFVMLTVFAAPELEPTSFVGRVPVPLLIVAALIIAVIVVRIMVRRQYVRRLHALRNHLAGNHGR